MPDSIDMQKVEHVDLRPTLTLQGKWNRINIGMDTIKALQFPEYICLLRSTDGKSIAVTPCKANQIMSFHVPERFRPNSRKTFTINSKMFVQGVIFAHGLNPLLSYVMKGELVTDKPIVVFQLDGCVQERDTEGKTNGEQNDRI